MYSILLGIAIIIIILIAVKISKSEKSGDSIIAEQLRDSRDRKVSLDSATKRVLTDAKSAAYYIRNINSATLDLSAKWFEDLTEIVDAANVVIYNSRNPKLKPGSKTFNYFNGLYIRLVNASAVLTECEQSIGEAVLSLHKIRFNTITKEERKAIMLLQKILPRVQSIVSAQKRECYSATHNAKILIGKCGKGGRIWLERNIRNKQIRYGKK